MSSSYNEVGRWTVGTPDGNSEEMILEKNKLETLSISMRAKH